MMEKLKELAMNPAHEILFREKTAKTTGKYFWAANIFVLLFQIYNILYTLFLYRFPAEIPGKQSLYGSVRGYAADLYPHCRLRMDPDSRQKRKKRKASSSLHSIWLPAADLVRLHHPVRPESFQQYQRLYDHRRLYSGPALYPAPDLRSGFYFL